MEPITMGLMLGSSLLGGLLGNRNQTQTQRSNQGYYGQQNATNYNRYSNTNRVTPELDPLAWDFRNEMIGSARDLLKLPTPERTGEGWFNAYQSNAANTINRNAQLNSQMLGNKLAASGFGNSALGAYTNQLSDAERVRQLGDLQANMPMLRRQVGMEDTSFINDILAGRLGAAGTAFSRVPVGQYSEQSGDQFGTTSQENKGHQQSFQEMTMPGNMAGGGFMSLANAFAKLPPGTFGFGGGTGGYANPLAFMTGMGY